jgi:coproporphyrinogen III oxidase
MSPNRDEIAQAYREIQTYICEQIAAVDGKATFGKDEWVRPEGGGGLTRVLIDGDALEKAGVNFSAVEGPLSPVMAKNLKVEAGHFFATGVSIVMHPHNPHVPIIHMNIRYFEMSDGTYWFGGGIDLTPHYIVPEDARFFHREVKDVCDRFDDAYYPTFKTWADDYFFNEHRDETRGVGGIFYDHLKADPDHSKASLLDFSLAIGKLFPTVYAALINKHRNTPFTATQKHWQGLRRGRYVEFNLVYDRGTRFGLLSNGRIESILMSLPAEARWDYNHIPVPGSDEAMTLSQLKKGIDWAGA